MKISSSIHSGGDLLNWNAIGAVAELFGAVGAIVSLLYLATQLRQSNVLAKRNAVQTLLASRGELNRFLASDPAISDLYWRGLDSPDDLNESEWHRFIIILSTLVRQFEAIHTDHDAGLLSDGIWQSQNNSIQRWMSKPGAQRVLKELKADFDPEFVRHVLVEGQ